MTKLTTVNNKLRQTKTNYDKVVNDKLGFNDKLGPNYDSQRQTTTNYDGLRQTTTVYDKVRPACYDD
jgi:hypothetical protein